MKLTCGLKWLIGSFAIASCAHAAQPELPPPYVPQQQVAGAIRIWGHGAYGGATDFIEGLTRAWEEGFRKHHRGVQFENRLHGTASAIGALYTGTGDLALMGREIRPHEIAAFEEVFHYPPTGVDVVTGSFDVRNRGYAIVVFVHKDNPLKALTLAQLDAIYGVGRRRGAPAVRTWGDLGLTGEWRDRPVTLYGLPIARGFADYFEERVFLGSRKWNPSLREFADQSGSKGGATDGGQRMLNALAKDPSGIGYAGLVYRHADVKPLAIAEKDGGPYVEPTRENVLNRTYPLTRTITMFFNRAPGKPVDPKLKEFLRYILSREGQETVLREGKGYLPMIAPYARIELKKLEDSVPVTAQQSHPTEESRKLPPGSAEERKARMAARAAKPAYTKRFDLSGLPHYVPEDKPAGKLRVCGNSYVGDSPLGGWWKEAFEKFQPGIQVEYYLPTSAIAVPCLYFDRADIGINHEPGFYDYLVHLRLKGFEPTGFSVFTGSYNYVGWQNNLVIIVRKDNPLTKITVKQLDGIFGSARDGGWDKTTWKPEFSRGPEGDIRKWGEMGLTGEWADKRIKVYGYSLRYASALEFSNKVLQASDKWNGDLHAYGNYRRPDGTTYLEADQIFDRIRKDPTAIGYARYHEGFPKDIKILALAQTEQGPYVEYTIDNLQNRSYPLWGDQSFWVSLKPGTKMDPKVREFIRFVLSQEGQELVQRDGKYLPLTAEIVRAELKKLK